MSNVESPDRVLFFDGVCVFCNGAVELLLQLDRDKRFSFASLQGETAATARTKHSSIPRTLESLVLLDNDTVYLRSRAVFQTALHLPYPWRLLSWFRFMPRWLTDPPYALFARMRYRLFGKRDTCMVPPTQHRTRFLP